MLETQCAYLTAKVKELQEQEYEKQEKPKLSALIYEEHKAELEEKYYGKIVAIDNAERKIVGIGNDISEAYEDARKNSEKTKFSFKRVGYTDRL